MSSNKELMQRRSQAIPRGVGQIHPIFADRAENCRVWDVEGREYLDFAGGIAVLNTGHLHPNFAKKTLLVTTGSEAVENAVKIARAATKRSGTIAFSGAYHGRTHYTLALTGKVNPYSAGMGLMPGHVYRA
ncbi:MAG: aminotransferase class III-fold pyridoxal phosphate-dependent enzyme, partial [Escherichia coli]|nr:aminotransferase class III-fold pyridoxal phosphate-dependent enzyme [Escherichia coli]